MNRFSFSPFLAGEINIYSSYLEQVDEFRNIFLPPPRFKFPSRRKLNFHGEWTEDDSCINTIFYY